MGGRGVAVGGTGVGVGGMGVGLGVEGGDTISETEVAGGSGVSVGCGVAVGGKGVRVGVGVAVGEGGGKVGVELGANTMAGGVGGASSCASRSAEYVLNDVTNPKTRRIPPMTMRRLEKSRSERARVPAV